MDPIFSRKDDQTLVLTFRSAWSPPLCVYQTLVEGWGLQVRALFFEPLCCYAGIFENEKYCRFNDITLSDVHELPKELRDAFSIESYLSFRECEPETVKPIEPINSSNKDKGNGMPQQVITENDEYPF
jgi:hypothetical protein